MSEKRVFMRGIDKITRTIKASFKEVWGYTTGKVGIILLFTLISISIYAVLTMPPRYGDLVWFNPTHWEENPQLAPPEWVSVFGVEYAKQASANIEYPFNVTRDPRTRYWSIEFKYSYELDAKATPQGILIKVYGIKVAKYGENIYLPIIEAYVIRPDNLRVMLAQITLSTEGVNKTVDRIYVDSPYLVRIDFTRLAVELANKLSPVYNITLRPDDISHLELSYLFGKPVMIGNETHPKPLEGTYTIVVKFMYPPFLTNPRDAIKMVRFVVKGTAYGFMGTDIRGRDLAQGLLYGFPVAMVIGVVVAAISVLIGVFMGIISGYYGGLIDEGIQRLIDVLGNIPLLPILVLIGAIAQQMFTEPVQRLGLILLVLIVFGWGGLAIVVRSMTLSIKEEAYIEAARALGAGNRRIIFKHVLPQIIPYAVASMVFSVPSAILTEAGLSVLGIRHGMPTWGAILADARNLGRLDVWWWIVPPGLLISITSLTFVLLGMAIERIVEPRLRTA